LLRYFRINDPYRLLGIFIIGAILYLPVLLNKPVVSYPELKGIVVGEKVTEGNLPYADLIDSTPPLTSWLYGLIDLMFGRSLLARHILAFLLILFQATYFAIITIDRKIYADSTYIPPLLFVILFAFSYDNLALTGELFGSGFLLLALNNLYKELEFRNQRDDTVLGLGLYISFASLCSFSYVVFLMGSMLILIFYRRDIRTFLLLIVGFALPHLLLISVYFLMDEVEALIRFYYAPNLLSGGTSYVSFNALFILAIIPFTFLVFSLFLLSREGRLTKYQSQVLQSMFFWLLFSVVSLFASKDLRPQSVIAVIPPTAYFLTHLFLALQRRIVAELGMWILLIGTGLMSYCSWNGIIQSVDYSPLKVEQKNNENLTGKRLLVLENDISHFLNNEMATPFFSWELSKPIFSDADYYQNVIRVSAGFNDDSPEYIIDPHGYMKPFLERIPALQQKYKLVNNDRYELR
jgi:hypothetical protein